VHLDNEHFDEDQHLFQVSKLTQVVLDIS